MNYILKIGFKEKSKINWEYDTHIIIADSVEDIIEYCNEYEEDFEKCGYEVKFYWTEIREDSVVDLRKNKTFKF